MNHLWTGIVLASLIGANGMAGLAADPPTRAERLKAIRSALADDEKAFRKGMKDGTHKPDSNGDYPAWDALHDKCRKQVRQLIDTDPTDDVGLQALLFSLGHLRTSEPQRDLEALVLKHHLARKEIDPLVRADVTPEFLATVREKSPHEDLRLWATYGLAENLVAADKKAEAEKLLETLKADKRAVEMSGYGSGTLADTADRLLFQVQRLNVGQQVPEVTGTDIDGKPMKLSDSRGKVTLLVFWATWCGPCVQMIPHEVELVERFKDKPFALVGANGDILVEGFVAGTPGHVDEERDKVLKVLKKLGVTWRSFRNAQDEGDLSRWGIRTWPTVFLMDHHGIIQKKWSGRPESKKLDAEIEKLLAAVPKAAGP